jgi:hypothetical protein
MTAEEVRDRLDRVTFPLVLTTRDGRSYRVPSPRTCWLPEDYPTTLVLAARGQGVSLIGLSTIASVRAEDGTTARIPPEPGGTAQDTRS